MAPRRCSTLRMSQSQPQRTTKSWRTFARRPCAPGDIRLRRAAPFFLRVYSGLFRPSKINILGMEFAGAVESVGKRVTLFNPGDEVFGSTGLRFGAYADYVCVCPRVHCLRDGL